MYNNKHQYFLESPLGKREVFYDPMGSEETESELKRSEKTWGITVRIINNLEFVDSDKDWLLQNKAIYGANAQVRLTVYSKNPYTDEYEMDYTGFLDFTKITEDRYSIKIDFIEGGLRETFTSLKKKKVELNRVTDINDQPISELFTDRLNIKGRDIFLSSRLDSKDTTQFEVYSGEWDSQGNFRYAFQGLPMEVDYTGDDNIATVIDNIGSDNHGAYSYNMFYYIADRDRNEIKINLNTTLEIVGGDIGQSSDRHLQLVLRKFTGGDSFTYTDADDVVLIDIGDPAFVSGAFSVNYSGTIQPLEGESYAVGLYLKGKYGGGLSKSSVRLDIGNYNSYMTLEEDSFFEATTSKCLTMFDVGKRLSEIYTGVPCFRSDLLSSGEWKDLVATCGGWLRDLKKKSEEAEGGEIEWPMTYSFDDFFKDVYAIVPCAYSIETEGNQQYIRLEKIQDYFVPRKKIFLGKVTDYKKESAADLIFSSVKFGYTEGGNYEKPLGLDEPNVNTTWVSPLRKEVSEYNALAAGRSDSYGVEQARRLPAAQYPDRDSPFDKDNFIIDAKEVQPRRGRVPGYYEPRLWQDDFAVAPKNVYSPDTLFNARITPAHNRNRHAVWFKAGIQLDAVDSGDLIYTSSEGNSELITQLIGQDPVKENQPSTAIDSLPNRILEADYITCKVPYSYELNQQLKGVSTIKDKEIPNIYCLVELINDKNEKESGYIISEKHKKDQPLEFKIIKAYGI